MATTEAAADRGRLLRYIVNGLVATVVHYVVLSFGLEVLRIPSAGLANLMAAGVGITTSFLGSRYFVFLAGSRPVLGQASRFIALYALIALLHGATLWLWSDMGGLDYRIGFLLATCMQVALSYFGNKHLVFR